MGEIIHMPARPQVVERYTAIKSYGEFGRMSLVLARMVTTEPTPLTLVLDGLPEGIGFEILGRAHDTPDGIALADHMAHAVTMALMHICEDRPV